MNGNTPQSQIASMLSRAWWLIVLRAVVAIAFGILTYVKPGISLEALVIVFGAFAMADGILRIWAAIAGPGDNESRWMLALAGVIGIGIGVLTMFRPDVTALALVYYIAAWAIVSGALEITAAIRLRQVIDDEWLLALAGILSLAFGVMILARPGAGALALLWLIGTYAIVFGVLLLIFAFKARGFVNRVKQA